MVDEKYAELIAAASAARDRAYTPYSHFAVGAAVLAASGQIYVGCNIENASYPMTMCAERVALYNAYAAGERSIEALAVVTDTDDVASPCGGCRQVIAELAPDSTILLFNTRGQQRWTTPRDLLPFSFGASQLDEAARSTQDSI